jgi:hypothetical protein
MNTLRFGKLNRKLNERLYARIFTFSNCIFTCTVRVLISYKVQSYIYATKLTAIKLFRHVV